jgi:hypothetical protein
MTLTRMGNVGIVVESLDTVHLIFRRAWLETRRARHDRRRVGRARHRSGASARRDRELLFPSIGAQSRSRGRARAAPDPSVGVRHPRAGTPLLAASPTVGLDLPLKVLIWEGADGTVTVGYASPAWLGARHGVPAALRARPDPHAADGAAGPTRRLDTVPASTLRR